MTPDPLLRRSAAPIECPICKAEGGPGVMNCAHQWRSAAPVTKGEE